MAIISTGWYVASVCVHAVAVAVTFFVCWAPFHTQRIITSCVDDDDWTPALIELQHGLFHVSGTLQTSGLRF